MSVERAFILSAILLAAVGFSSLVLVGNLSAGMLTLAGAAFIVSVAQHVLAAQQVPWLFTLRLSRTAWNVLLVIAFVSFWIDLLWISRDLLTAGVQLLIMLLINKLFHLHHRRDILQLYAVSFMAIVSSAAMTTHIWHAPIFAAYLVTAVWTLTLYHLTKEQEETASFAGNAAAGDRAGSGTITPPLFWATNALAVCASCITVILFFLIPRVGAGLSLKTLGGQLRTSGFTDHVELGVMGPVKQDPSIVMRVELKGGPTSHHEPLYLRGMAYDRYNGNSWSNGSVHRRNLLERPPGLFTVRADPGRAPSSHPEGIRQDIVLEALDTTVLFGAPQVLSLSGDFAMVQSDHMNVLYLPFPSLGRVQYVVRSRPPRLLQADISAVRWSYPESVRRQYLQLPPLDPGVAGLTHQIVEDSRTPYEAVVLIRQHLLKNYRYSLDIASDRSAHPLEDFLFTRKTGYCEHYATAMVVMLRTIGLPARLVTGFLASEWNEFAHYYTVRQRDAHAWVEVYFPESGWMTFDPTPPDPGGVSTPWWHSLDGAWASMRLRWDRLIIQYSGTDQLSVVQEVRDRQETLQSNVSTTIASWMLHWLASISAAVTGVSSRPAREVGLVLLIGGSLLIIWRVVRRRGTGRSDGAWNSSERTLAISWYQQMLDAAAAQGFPKPLGKTPMEFARYVEKHWTDAAPHIDRLTHLYCRARFGLHTLTQEDRVGAEAALRALSSKDGRGRYTTRQ